MTPENERRLATIVGMVAPGYCWVVGAILAVSTLVGIAVVVGAVVGWVK